jgi:exonuclease III
MNDTSANSDTSEFPLHCSSPLKSAPIKKLDNKLRSVCLNIQSIKSKREAIWNFHDSSNPDILFGCETWLNPNITDNEILPENTGYNIFRKDRKDGYGGVMLAIKAEIVSEPVDSDIPCEFIARKINRNTHDSLIVATIYRPRNNDVDYAKALYNTIKSLCLRYLKSTIWIAGDFNLPDIDWLTNTFRVTGT